MANTSQSKPPVEAGTGGQVGIEKAHKLGFCFGVRRAIRIIESAAREHRGIVTLGPIVHNQLVVARLAEMGVKVIEGLDQVQHETIAIPSHGIPPQLQSQIEARQLRVIDTTCPIVRSAQEAARKLGEDGFCVIVFGDAHHPEVKGLLGWAGTNVLAAMDASEVANLSLPHRVGILAQTTQSYLGFIEFVSRVITTLWPRVRELRIINTLCPETLKRQQAALELAERSELMIVVGGRNSANTRRLAEVCSPIVETHLIETAAEIDTHWLAGKKHVGITAGASTPDEAIEEVMLKLESLAGGDYNL